MSRRRERPAKKLTHGELATLAEGWLVKWGCSFAFRELTTINLHGEIPDAIGWKSGTSILIECKTSRSDFLADRKKKFRSKAEYGMGEYRFYMTPKGLLIPDELPHKWGLLEVDHRRSIRRVHGPTGTSWHHIPDLKFIHQYYDKASEKVMFLSALRRFHLRGRMSEIYEPRPKTKEKRR